MGIWGDFQGLTEATGGGRGVKKRENLGDVVYGWSLTAGKLQVSRLHPLLCPLAPVTASQTFVFPPHEIGGQTEHSSRPDSKMIDDYFQEV